jgi:pimeloyl-ACP methyl ester carboxylesterase
MAYYQLSDSVIAYTDSPGGDRSAPAIVFVHGMCCDRSDWAQQTHHFEERCRRISIDLNAHGESTINDSDAFAQRLNMPNLGSDVCALLVHLNISACLLVGHSMGCRVIVEAAHQRPEIVNGVVMVDGSRFADNTEDAEEISRTLDDIEFAPFVGNLFSQMFTADSDSAFVDHAMARAKKMPARLGRALFSHMLNWDASHMDTRLVRLVAPVMIIQSTMVDANRQRRPLNKGETSPWLEYLTGFVPQSDMHILPGIGHFTQIDAPVEVNTLLDGFYDDLFG